MAEPQAQPEGADKRQQPPNGTEQQISDLETALARLAEAERKYGTLVNENKRIKTARDDLSEKLKRWNGLDEVDPDKVRKLLEDERKADHEKARESGDLDKLVANATKASEEKAAKAERERDAALAKVQRVFIDDRLNQLLEKYIEPKYKKAVFAMLRPKMEALDDPESDYGIRTVVKVDDDYMSADEFIKHWAETDDEAMPFLKASLAGGGGAAPNSATARLRFKARTEMNAREKSDYINAHGIDAYNALPFKRASS